MAGGGEVVVVFATTSSVSSLNGGIFINYERLRRISTSN